MIAFFSIKYAIVFGSKNRNKCVTMMQIIIEDTLEIDTSSCQ
jgi:hypothetical protein